MVLRTTRSSPAAGAIAVASFAMLITGAHALAASSAPGQKVSGQLAARTVNETDRFQFEPMTIRVVRGDVVEWTDTGAIAHNVTFDRYPAMTSGTMNTGDRFQIRFNAAGTYQYRCTFHPGMNGTVTVSP
jgi:plastocyanin